MKTPAAAGFRHQAPAHYAQDEKVKTSRVVSFDLLNQFRKVGNCFFVLKRSNFRKTQVAAQPCPSVCPTTWPFDLILQLPAFASEKDNCLVFLAILKDVQDN